jgi:hypothetical protein
MDRKRRRLRDENLDDVLKAIGLVGLARRLPSIRRIFDGPVSEFASLLEELDLRVGRDGLQEASKWFIARLHCRVVADPPPVGPALFVCNHPGLGDALAVFSLISDPRLKILALDRPVLGALENLHERLLTLALDGSGTTALLRQTVEHLKSGGSVLTFPAGKIEPDPAWADPPPTFEHWSESPTFLARRVPGLKLIPILVSGVRLQRYVDPWVTRFHRKSADREWAGAILQLAHMARRGKVAATTLRVQFGKPVEESLHGPKTMGVIRGELGQMAKQAKR